MKDLGLIPLRNFGIVNESKNIFRSAQPLYKWEYEWIRDVLGVETIINLRSELNHDEYMNSAGRLGFNIVTFGVDDHREPTIEQAQKFMELIRSGKNILFHCEHGHGRTSTFCVLAKMAMGMSYEDALEEEKSKYHYSFRHHCQEQFLETFKNKSNAQIQ